MSGSPLSAGGGGARRRKRRGSVERPVNARLYRSSFLVVSLPLLILAFSITRPAPLPAPLLPPNFDGAAALELATDFSKRFPDRQPDAPGSLPAAQWFRDEMKPYLPVSSDSWSERVPGLGRARLHNLWAVVRGQSSDAIVVMAHRDNTGVGPGANDNASGTAALVELARGYAQADTPAGERVRPVHTLVFLSTDGGSYGSLGAVRFAKQLPFRIVAVVNLRAVAGAGQPRIVIAGEQPRSAAATLVETAAKRVLEQTGSRAARAGFAAQLLDLAFPYTLYEQGPFVARGVPALTLTTAGERPPDAFTDRRPSLVQNRLTAMGRAAQDLIGSLDQGSELAQGTTAFVWVGDRIIRGWAVQLLLIGLLVPFLVGAVDLFARCRRRGIPLAPAARSLRTRLAFWLFAGVAFYAFGAAGAWPAGSARPPAPGTVSAGDWPVVALIGLAAVLLLGWIVGRHRLVPRRRVTADELLAGETIALLGLGIVTLLVLATNPFALIFILPAAHAWLWLPQVRSGHISARVVVFAVGLAGPILLVVTFASRYGLGLDAPWYLVELAAVGYVQVAVVAIVLGWCACGSQLAAVSAGRYGPYPPASERPARGPVRELVRTVVLTSRSRRRAGDERRRAVGG
jgi:hypothetical protein